MIRLFCRTGLPEKQHPALAAIHAVDFLHELLHRGAV